MKKSFGTFIALNLSVQIFMGSFAFAASEVPACKIAFDAETSAAKAPSLMHQLPNLNLNGRFIALQSKFGSWKAGLSESVRTVYNYEVYRMLQEAFYPLLRTYTAKVAQLSESEIQKRLVEAAVQSEIKKSGYVNNTEAGIQYPQHSPHPHPWFKLNSAEIDKMNTRRFANRIGSAKDKLDKANEFLYVEVHADQPKELGLVTAMQEQLITPVGEYGTQFSEKLLRTTQIMRKLLAEDPTVRELSLKLTQNGSEFLKAETARMASGQSEQVSPILAPVASALEGVLSLHQLFANVLSKKIPGDESGSQALHDLIFNSEKKSGLISELTSRHPLGTVGPMALSGSSFRTTFERTPDGKLTLSPEVKSVLAELASKAKSKSRCPMAGLMNKTDSKTGLQELAEAYWHVYNVVDKSMIVSAAADGK